MQGFSLTSDILFSGSVNNNGKISAYVSDKRCIYEIDGANENTEPNEARYISDTDLPTDDLFLFSVGGESYLFDGTKILKSYVGEFGECEFGASEAVISPLEHTTLPQKDILDAINILTGIADLRFSLPCDTNTLTIEYAPQAVISVSSNGSVLSGTKLDGNTLTFAETLSKGNSISLTLSYPATELSELKLIGCSDESDGEAYLYSPSALYRLTKSDGGLVLSNAVLSLPEGGIRCAFFCSGVLTLAIGAGICVYDRKSGTLRLIDSDGVNSKDEICPCGGFAFISTGTRISKLSVSRSGESEELKTVTMKDTFADSRKGKILSMAYSRADRCLWTVCKMNFKNRIFVLDTDSGIWFEVTGVDDPSACFECSDSIVIVSGTTVYFTSPSMTADYRNEEYFSISGEIVLSGSDLGDPTVKKRIYDCAVNLSGPVTDFSVTVEADNGRSDTYSDTLLTDKNRLALPVFRMNVGHFSYLTIKATLTGRDNAALHDVYLGTVSGRSN